jgi:hypothetical protein
MNDLIEGTYIPNIKCESFKDSDSYRIRVRPLPDQGVPTYLMIECSKEIRERYPVGTKFTTENVKVCRNSHQGVYLRAKDQMIYKID